MKGNIGLTETAAGVAGLLKILAMIQHTSIPPQASHQRLNPKIAPLGENNMEIVLRTVPWEVELMAACVNSYGAAGSNCALICCRGPKEMSSKHTGTVHPVLITAAHPVSLHDNIQALARFLKGSHKTQIRDLAYTLSQRRKIYHLAFASSAASPQDLSQKLNQRQGAFFQAPANPRKVVLAFGGQSKRSIDMPKALYETYPQIRHCIDECDKILQDLGHPSLFPSIFETEPVRDVVLLQCGTFAVQYACAKCWIHAGVQVATVIGHSFGELTAIVISGVLSLRDGLKLIASRADLMMTKWGPERGVMLAVQGDRKLMEDALSVTGQETDTLEEVVQTACFNAPSSHVLVGTSGAIWRTENLLRTDTRFSALKSQRLEVTHGFHSCLTEPVLEELKQVSASLKWAKPSIVLETCTAHSNIQVSSAHPASHARQPVFFYDAVRRIEQKLGPCLWLEAGLNSPIVPMVKRAVAASDKHEFQSLTFSESQEMSEKVLEATVNLWREGIPVSDWAFLPPYHHPFRHIWLPPYQFRRTSFWIPNIDRATEAQRSTGAYEVMRSSEQPKSLIKARSDEIFEICVDSGRFTKILTGHAVLNRPLCPASLYLESVAIALKLRKAAEQLRPLRFVDTNFQAPLGSDANRAVTLTLKSEPDVKGWTFIIKSSSKTDLDSKVLTHAKGRVTQFDRHEFDPYQRLIGGRVNELRERPEVDTFGCKRAYNLFSRVVRYAEFFQGISSIALGETEAVATITPPEESWPGLQENPAMQFCDSVVIDMFIQVVGLQINTGHLVNDEDVYVATGTDSLSISPSCDFISPGA